MCVEEQDESVLPMIVDLDNIHIESELLDDQINYEQYYATSKGFTFCYVGYALLLIPKRIKVRRDPSYKLGFEILGCNNPGFIMISITYKHNQIVYTQIDCDGLTLGEIWAEPGYREIEDCSSMINQYDEIVLNHLDDRDQMAFQISLFHNSVMSYYNSIDEFPFHTSSTFKYDDYDSDIIMTTIDNLKKVFSIEPDINKVEFSLPFLRDFVIKSISNLHRFLLLFVCIQENKSAMHFMAYKLNKIINKLPKYMETMGDLYPDIPFPSMYDVLNK